MTLKQARKKYPNLPVISQVKQLQDFTEDEYGFVILPRAIIAVDLIDSKYSVDEQSIVCDGVRVGDDNEFGGYIDFGGGCRFGGGCWFGEHNIFDMPVNINNTVYTHVHRVDSIGSRSSSTYFFMCDNEIYVYCGCYNGSIDNFAETVEMEHMYNELYLTQYREAIAGAREKHQELFKNKEV